MALLQWNLIFFLRHWSEKGCNQGLNSCCTEDVPCGLGEGDCDSDRECGVGMACGSDNCHPVREGGFSASDDCCEMRRPCLGQDDCCTKSRGERERENFSRTVVYVFRLG